MAKALGTRIKELREGRQWSLREAAEMTGVSKSMLSKIERQATSPTATILGRIAEGFGISISQLVGGEEQRGDIVVIRRTEQPVFKIPTTGFERRSLSPLNSTGNNPDLVANVLPPLQSSGTFPPHRAGVEETLVVAAGKLRLYLANVQYELAAGDSIFYRAQVPHSFDNPSDKEETVFYIMINNAGGS